MNMAVLLLDASALAAEVSAKPLISSSYEIKSRNQQTVGVGILKMLSCFDLFRDTGDLKTLES